MKQTNMKPTLLRLITAALMAFSLDADAQTPLVREPNKFQANLYFDKLAQGMKTGKKTAIVGSKTKGKAFTALPKEGAHLVGIAAHKGEWFGTPMITSFQPIFEGKTGRFRGDTCGAKGEELKLVEEAKPGYVVTQILVSAPNEHVHGVRLVYQKLDVFRQSVVEKNTYMSEWIGVEFKEKSEKLGVANRIATGLHGMSDDWVAGLGLFQAL